MFWGNLSKDDELILEKIMQYTDGFEIVNNEIHFDAGNGHHVVAVSYQKKPKDRLFYEDKEQSDIIKRCILIDLNGMKVPIFKYGEIFTNVCFSNSDIVHPVYIKNNIAKEFYEYIIRLYDMHKED
ncbi:MAG: hypothetical protein ACOZCL_15485 [Bacillota bacterium]